MGQTPNRPGGPWSGILLAASVLGSCLQPVPAQTTVPIVLTPRSPEVGGDVSLAPQNLPQDVLVCSWYRSATTHESSRILTYYPPPAPDQIPGPAHTGRETAGPGCTLHIAGLTLSDTGNYTVLIQSRTGTNPVRSIRVVLRVSDAPRPALSAGAVAGILIWSLAGAALVGVGAYFLYSHFRNKTPKKNGAPVLVYENLPLTAWAGPVAQPGSPPDPSPTYQTLQPRQPDVYEELKK
ncbi:carcinoembryonic antigen-related cell adhesion molecule 3-like [Terrapene carolina triunguis]|uniref:carcinoembryonic antigen-related cell adhesion molecule 3-like n=1 Tax=Terrapene triunguis TaxID=2587831 RepID=UPI000E77E73F|nr:carcinoembryonic antigen-related cell adhesion molecule 3-like [Terrapene carolina triunguis]